MSENTFTPPKGRTGLNAVYGNPRGADGKLSESWRAANIVSMDLPYPMRIAWDVDETVRRIAVHKKVAPLLREALQEVWNEARRRAKAAANDNDGSGKSSAEWDAETMKYLRRFGLDLYGGAFNYRLKRGGSSLSTHSYGCAIDIDPEHNGMGDQTPAIPLWVVEIFEKRGWVAGYRWEGRSKDGMHFQYATGV